MFYAIQKLPVLVPGKQAQYKHLFFLSDKEVLHRISNPRQCLYSLSPSQLKHRITVLEHFKIRLGDHFKFGLFFVLPRSAHVLAAIDQAQAQHQEALETLELAAQAQHRPNVIQLRRAHKAKCNRRLRARAKELAA